MLTRAPFAASTQRHTPQSRSHALSHGVHVHQTLENAQSHRSNYLASRSDHIRSVSGPYQHTIPDAATHRRNASMIEDATALSRTAATESYEEDEEARPKKRARFEAEGDIVASPQALQPRAIHEVVGGRPLGFPLRPVESRKRQQGRRQETGENAARKAVGVTPPVMATRLPAPKNVADFSPWTGAHPEDILNEQVVKNGYSEKGPSPNQNESNSARPTVWPSLSQKNGIALQTLSLLYTQVLEKRQVLGKCTAPSTFKPPPRVTVTDTKREAWLRDLANPSVPLRRQSRTIPHGIRGKLLLEQCITKAIPLQRAVWLAKCVGANELRAFKRKGVSGLSAAQGEAKWIRDWTIAIEQFLGDVAVGTTKEGWRIRLEYAVKLVTAIYTEGLLERDHFLDWIVTSLTTATLDQAPSWMLLVQIYWRDIVSFGRRGRLLAKALLVHLHTATESGQPAYDDLKAHLRRQIMVMMAKAQHCLILPELWDTDQHLIEDIAVESMQSESVFSAIRSRNERLLEPSTKSSMNLDPSFRLFTKLDKVILSVDMSILPQECLDIMPDALELVTALLLWASTRYRQGKFRSILAERIIAGLHHVGVDTDTAILQFLAGQKVTSSIDTEQTYAVIAGLLRHGSFSAGRYLKWLITSGAMTGPSMSIARGLLAKLPSKCLPQHLKNTQASLLSRLQHQGSTTDKETEAVKDKIQENLADATLPLRVDIVLAGYPQINKSDLIAGLTIPKDSAMTLHTFCVLRTVFEDSGQLDPLIELLEAASGADDFLLLGSVADTINTHVLELAATTRLADLVERVEERYRILRTQQPLERTSICAVKSLAIRLTKTAFVRLLTNDLTIYERRNLSAVCSPASDSLVGMQAGNIETDDEIDAVFASGNTMDEQLTQRVFLRTVQKAEKAAIITSNSSPVCRWLAHIHLLDQTTFESIIKAYLINFLSNPSQQTLPNGVYNLVAANCYELKKIVSCLDNSSSSRSVAAVLRLLAAPLPDSLALSNPERYHLLQERATFRDSQPGLVARLLTKSWNALDEHDVSWIADLVASSLHQEGFRLDFSDAGKLYQATLIRLDSDTFGNMEFTPAEVIQKATTLNARFCAGWLKSNRMGVDTTKSALVRAVMSASPVWSILLQACHHSIIADMHTWAIERLLNSDIGSGITSGTNNNTTSNAISNTTSNAINNTTSNALNNPTSNAINNPISNVINNPTSDTAGSTASNTTSTAIGSTNSNQQKLVSILDVTHAMLKQNTDQGLLTSIASRLKAVQKSLAMQNEDTDDARSSIFEHVEMLLHVTTLCTHSTTDDASTQGRAYIVLALCSILSTPTIERRIHLVEYITDVACMLIDQLPAELVPRLAKSARTAGFNEKIIASCFGTVVQMDSWLALATAGSPASRSLLKLPRTTPGQPAAKQAANSQLRYATYPIRRWEVMQDPTPVIGENDSSISLTLFGARKI